MAREKNQIKSRVFCNVWKLHKIQISVSIYQFLLGPRHAHLCAFYGYLCAVMAELNSFRDNRQRLKYLQSGSLQKKKKSLPIFHLGDLWGSFHLQIPGNFTSLDKLESSVKDNVQNTH